MQFTHTPNTAMCSSKGNITLRACFCLLLALFTSCLETKNLNLDQEEEQDGQEAIQYVEINVHITSDTDGLLCTLYYDYPYNDNGELVAKPCLKAYTPVESRPQVPSTVQKIYVITSTGQLIESSAKAVNIHSPSAN